MIRAHGYAIRWLEADDYAGGGAPARASPWHLCELLVEAEENYRLNKARLEDRERLEKQGRSGEELSVCRDGTSELDTENAGPCPQNWTS